jgi:WD40 repeat protein
MRILLLPVFTLFLVFSCDSFGQNITPLFRGQKVEVKYAMFSPDGRYLAVGTAGDSIVVFETSTLRPVRVIKAFTSVSTVSDSYTGKKIFHINKKNEIIYIGGAVEGDNFVLSLRSELIDAGKVVFSTRIHSVTKAELEQEKLYGYLTYGLSANGNILTFFRNDKVVLYDAASYAQIAVFRIGFVVHAVTNNDGKSLAIATPDSIKVIEVETGKQLTRIKREAQALRYLDNNLLAVGNENSLINASGQVERNLYYAPGYHYNIEINGEGSRYTISTSYFYHHGFVASVGVADNDLKEIYHLPKTDGYTAFYHPVTGELWMVTTRGLLYHFARVNEPKPVSQAGHRNKVVAAHFAKDKRTLITASGTGEIILWDVNTGRVMERFATNITGIETIFLDRPDRDIIVSFYDDFRKIHRSIPSNAESGSTHNIFMDPADTAFANGYMREWRKAKRSPEIRKHTFDENKPTVQTKTFVAGFTSDGVLKTYRITDGQAHHIRLPENDINYSQMLEHYRENIVIAEGNGSTIVFVDLMTGKIVKRLGVQRPDYVKGIQKVLFNETADTLVTVQNQHYIQLWDLRKAEKILELNLGNRVLQEHAVDFQKNQLSALIENNNLYIAAVLNVKTNTAKMIAYLDTSFYQKNNDLEVCAYKGNGYPMRMKLSPDGKKLLILRLNNTQSRTQCFVDLWDVVTMKLLSSVGITQISYPCWNVSWKDNTIAVWDFLGMSRKEFASLQKRNQEMGLDPPQPAYGGIVFIDLLTNKTTELTLDHVGIQRLGSDAVSLVSRSEAFVRDDFDLVLHKVDINKKTIRNTVNVSEQQFHERVGSLYSVRNDTLLYGRHPWNEGHITGLVLWSIKQKRLVAEGHSSGTPVTSMTERHRTGVIAIGLNNNTISVRDANLRKRYDIVQDDDGHYAFITPDNFYKADRTSAAALQFSWNFRSYSLQQFDALYNRPDKVLSATGFTANEDLELLKKAHLKRKKMSEGVAILAGPPQDLPQVLINNIQELPLESRLDSIRLSVSGTNGKNLISRITVFVNGVPVRASKLTATANGVTTKLYVPLLPGKNRIKAIAEDEAGVQSLPDEIVIEHTGVKPKPDLYLITVAINNYKDTDLNLNYAVKDARDIIRFFREDTRFNKVIVDSIFNSAVTFGSIAGIRERLKKCKADDHVILFFAGHGVLDENFDFRYATWALETSTPSTTAVLYDDIEKLMEGILPRNKLLLIDACHSGEVDKDEIVETTEQLMKQHGRTDRAVVKQSFTKVHHNVFNTGMVDGRGFELMQELFYAPGSNSGAQVVVATAGDSYAIESAEWKNGFFTYALLNGLKSGHADANRDGSITVEEMVSYLKKEVKNMSFGKQIPRFRQENPENYFEVWRM